MLLAGLLLLALRGRDGALGPRWSSDPAGSIPFAGSAGERSALLAVVIGLPVVVLMPLFWLESQLPPEAVPALHLGPVMALLLVGLPWSWP